MNSDRGGRRGDRRRNQRLGQGSKEYQLALEGGCPLEEHRRLVADMRAAGIPLDRIEEFVQQAPPGTYPWWQSVIFVSRR